MKGKGLTLLGILFSLVICVNFISSLAVSNVQLNNSDGSQSINKGSWNLIVNFTTDGTETSNITDWRINNVSRAVINMPFDVNQTTLNSTVSDYSTYNNKGNATGTVPASYSTGCIKGGCFNFSGKNGASYIKINNHSSFNFNGADFSVSFWAKFDTNYSSFMPIISTSDVISNCVNFGIYRFNGGLRVTRANSTCVGSTGANAFSISNSLAKTNQWYHIVYTYSEGYGSAYINNVKYADSNYMVPSYVIDGLFIGRASATYYMNGTIDELKIFNYSLSDSEISDIYTAGLSNKDILNVSTFSLKNGNYSVAVWSVNSTQNSSGVLSNNLNVSTPCLSLLDGQTKTFDDNYNLSVNNCFIMANNSVIDCQGHIFNGTSQNLIYSSYKNNLSVNNCGFINYNQSLRLLNSENISVYNNSFINGSYNIYGLNLSNLSIINNTFFGSGYNVVSSIYIDTTNNSNISNNNFSLSDIVTSVLYISKINHSVISYNTFGSDVDEINSTVGLNYAVINLLQPNYNLVNNNDIYIGDNISGIIMTRVSGSTAVMNNNIIENNYLRIKTNNLIFGMVNSEGGVTYNHVNWTVRNNVVVSELGNTHGQHTFMIKYHNGSKIYNNSITNGGYGIVFKDNTFCELYNNSFINQTYLLSVHPKGTKNSSIYNNRIVTLSGRESMRIWWDDILTLTSENLTIYDNILEVDKVIVVDSGSSNINFINQSDVTYDFSDMNGSSAYIKWWFKPKIVDSSGNAILGATLSVSNSSTISLVNLTSDSSGYPSRFALEEYYVNESGSYYQDNYSVTISKSGYTSKTISFNLSLTNNYLSNILLTANPVVLATEQSSSPGATSKPTTSSLTEGYSRNFVKNQKIEITVDGEKEVIVINKITSEEVQFSVSGNNYSVAKNETKKFDLNSDGVYDLQISVEKIYTNGIAQMEFKLINEKIPSTEQTPAEEQTQNETPTEKSNIQWIILISVFVIAIVFVILKILSSRKFRK